MHTSEKSARLHRNSLRHLPWGSSTCSKKPKFLPEEPGVIVRGKGCRVWDADGREFIDFRNALGPITLGYGFPEVDNAIKDQLASGIIFGHPHPLEGEVAELLCEIIPCAEKSRFLKTGGEAVAAAIKIARAHTGRDHIIQTGYNGWLNIAAPGSIVLPGQQHDAIPSGVPHAVSELFHTCPWNQTDVMEKIFSENPGRIAAVLISCDYPEMAKASEFLPKARELCNRNNALLIFDEIVTGFRIAVGGAQEHFKVIPDLAVFAKGMANGMPLSVYLGKKEYMQVLDTATVSSTYGGETLSLAAAKTTIDIYKNRNVIEHLWQAGKKLKTAIEQIFTDKGLGIELPGLPPCSRFQLKSGENTDTLNRFFREAFKNGISLAQMLYVNFSHTAVDLDETADKLEKAVKNL